MYILTILLGYIKIFDYLCRLNNRAITASAYVAEERKALKCTSLASNLDISKHW